MTLCMTALCNILSEHQLQSQGRYITAKETAIKEAEVGTAGH